MRRLVLSLSLVALACAGARTFAGDPAPETVRAQLYRVVWTEGAMDLAHGGGRWVHEIFLPDAKVVVSIVPFPVEKGYRVHARRSEKPRNELVGLHAAEPSPIEEIRIPAALAKRFVDLADLTCRMEEESASLGEAVTAVDLPALPAK